MTPQEKAASTRREREQRRKAQYEAEKHDREQAIAVCRSIRDDALALDADRLKAIEILQQLKA